ncbi:carboxypeptidase-like regulatory domain-containing protein [Spirosoma gilvum]
MKPLYMLMVAVSLQVTACTEPEKSAEETPQPRQGVVSGRAIDSQGNPIANAEVVVNNTQFYNSNIVGRTDANGNYKLQVTPGSWYMRASVKSTYNGKTCQFDLAPDNTKAFAGSDGAICNFTWKLSGTRTGEFGDEGYYGGMVAVMRASFDFEMEDVELTLSPVRLVDGSAGRAIKQKLSALAGGDDGLDDIPVGQYTITARHAPTGKSMRVRVRNANQAYASSATANFNLVGVSRYRIELEVQLPE